MIKNSLILFLVLTLVSCKKDRLKDEQEVFIAKWNWIYSSVILDLCNPPSYSAEIYPNEIETNYSIEFQRKGKILLFKDSNLVSSHRIVFQAYGAPYTCNIPGYTYFDIALDNNDENDFDGCICEDTIIILRGFPYPDPDDACENYTSYFVKE